MSVIVRSTPHRRHRFRRAWRRARAVLGSVLLIGAATTGMMVVLVPALVVAGIASSGDGSGSATHEGRSTLSLLGEAWLLAVVICVSGWATGAHLLRGQRATVLWLRRFGYRDATRVVSRALDYIGRSWRVVTLDDAATDPIGVAAGLRASIRVMGAARRFGRRLVTLAGPVGKATAIICVIGIVTVVAWESYQGDLPVLLDSLTGADWPPDSTAARLLAIFVGVLIAEFVILLAYAAVLIAYIPFIGLSVLASGVGRGVAAAESAKSQSVRSRADIEVAASTSALAGRNVIAARLMVLTVDGSVWQETVTELAQQSDAAIIDVSEVTENVMWEIEEISRIGAITPVLIGRHDTLLRLQATTPSDDGATSDGALVGRLRGVLDGREVLAYTTGLVGRLRFERALFGVLEDTVHRAPVDRRSITRTLLVLVGLASFALAVREAAVSVAAL